MLRTVQTENGWVQGIEAADPRITAFKGIPFAAPPVGENRWRAPQPCEDWDGVRECYRFAPISMQSVPGIGDNVYIREWHVDPEIAMDEDCLYLNVWTGAKEVTEKQPVLVWFFGGGLQCGYPAEMEFDGERIARRGVVVVTVNYRVNVFGFLAHPQLTEEQPDAPTNFGSLDQQAALRWVQRNIAFFGGDPGNVTIAGQSAGGGSVMSQMACMDNEGLFHRAVVMSAMIRSPYQVGGIGVPEELWHAEENGEEAKITHELMGHVQDTEDGRLLQLPDEEQKKEFHSILEWADETKSFVVFGEEDQTYGRFETDIFVEENAYFELGIFSARVVRSYYEEQLVITAGVEKEWDAALVRPFLWKVNGGQCSLEEFGYMHDNKLTEDFAISVKPGEYHRFGYETDGKQIRLYVDGELQKEISIPYGPAFVSVVTDTKDEIIIKAVNFAGDVDPVSITLDCQVQGDYTVTLLSGEKGDENSFEEPEKVKNITVNMHGASSEFVYEAPPYSVSVLRLKKCEAF